MSKRIPFRNIFYGTYIQFLIFVSCSIHAQSPYKNNWTSDGIILGSDAIIALTGYAVENKTPALTSDEVHQLSRESVNWFDRSATYKYSENISKASDLLAGITILAPLTLLIDENIRKDWSTLAVMYFETTISAHFITSYAKGGVQRVRPFVYNSDVPMSTKTTSDARQSFFSRHTIWAFATAVFFSTVYGDYFPDSKYKTYLWYGSLFTAAAVGFLRYESGKHFPSDILSGAILGSAIGYVIPYLHKVNNENMSIVPSSTGHQFGIALRIQF